MDTCLSLGMDSPICLLGTLLTPSLIVFGLVKPKFSIYIYIYIYIYIFELEFKQISFEEFLYKGNVRVLGEMLSNFSKTHVLFGHNLAIAHPN